MAGISFGSDADSNWIVARWAFRQLLKDLSDYVPGNAPILEAIEQASHLEYLNVKSLEGGLRTELTSALERLCTGILSGTQATSVGESFPGDPSTQEQYRVGLEMLLTALRTSRG